jgi:hypothetical protein
MITTTTMTIITGLGTATSGAQDFLRVGNKLRGALPRTLLGPEAPDPEWGAGAKIPEGK